MLSWKHLPVFFALFFFLHYALAQECTESEIQECVTEQECQGIQTCINGQWSECVVNATLCEPGQARACIPIINGIECPTIDGLQQCSECGDFWLGCSAPDEVECCPNQTRTCDANGRQECTEEGVWGRCFDGESCIGVVCGDSDICTLDKCALGECVFIRIEKCCLEDGDCGSKEYCDENKCVELDCGECFQAKRHECTPRKKGVCCNGHWNKGYSSCEFKYSVTEDKVNSVDDTRANYFFGKGVEALDEGFLDLAKYCFMSAELAVLVFKQLDDYNNEIISRINNSFASIEKALDNREFKAVKKLMNKVKDLLELKKPPEPKKQKGEDNNKSGLPVEETKPETPWVVVIALVFVLIFLFALLIIEMKKRRIQGLPAGAPKGLMETEEE